MEDGAIREALAQRWRGLDVSEEPDDGGAAVRCHDGGHRPAVVVSERQGVVGDEQIGLAVGIAVEPAVDLG